MLLFPDWQPPLAHVRPHQSPLSNYRDEIFRQPPCLQHLYAHSGSTEEFYPVHEAPVAVCAGTHVDRQTSPMLSVLHHSVVVHGGTLAHGYIPRRCCSGYKEEWVHVRSGLHLCVGCCVVAHSPNHHRTNSSAEARSDHRSAEACADPCANHEAAAVSVGPPHSMMSMCSTRD